MRGWHKFVLSMHMYLSFLADRRRPQRRRRHRLPPMSRTSSFSSITDSTMSLNIITVSLNMDTVNFLGISIVGQSNKGGDGGIYVGSIMKGLVHVSFNLFINLFTYLYLHIDVFIFLIKNSSCILYHW